MGTSCGDDFANKIPSVTQDIQEAVNVSINDALDEFGSDLTELNLYTKPAQERGETLLEDSDWATYSYDSTRKVDSEGFINLKENFKENFKEGSENMQQPAFLSQAEYQAWADRYDAFKEFDYFEEDAEDNAIATLDEVIPRYKKQLDEHNLTIETYLDSYYALYTNKVSIDYLVAEKMKNLNKIQNKIDTYKQNLFIDSRKDTYENSNYDFYKSIYFYVLLVYYILVISYFIFTPFFQEKKYLNYKLVIIIVLYIFFPFILPYLLSLIYNVYEYIIETNNLREEIISYPYIIEDKEKYK